MVKEAMQSFRQPLSAGKQVAFVVRKDALWYENKRTFQNDATLGREEAIREIVAVSGEDPVVCTTGNRAFDRVAKECGYVWAETVSDPEALRNALSRMREADGPAFLEIRCSLGARKDLGRPDTTPQENKAAFMEAL